MLLCTRARKRPRLPILALCLLLLASASPLQVKPITDALLTDLRSWSAPGCDEGGANSAAWATCGGGDDHADESDVDYMCEELGMRPHATHASPLHAHGRSVIVDSFMFNNEFDILLVRLRELAQVVDYFVLVEANVSHSGLPKQALFAEHAHLFSAFAPQLVRVQLDEVDYRAATAAAPPSKVNWAWEEHSRAAIARGLQLVEHLMQRKLASSDIVIVTDVDEVPSRTFVRGLRLCNVTLPAKMNMNFFYYSLRHVVVRMRTFVQPDILTSRIRWLWLESDTLAHSRWPQGFVAAADKVAAGQYAPLNYMRFRSCNDPAVIAAGAAARSNAIGPTDTAHGQV